MPIKIAEKKSRFFYYGKVIIFLLILFGFGYLPAIEPLTPFGMKVLGIFLAFYLAGQLLVYYG